MSKLIGKPSAEEPMRGVVGKTAEAIAAAWAEAREVYPLYSYLAMQFHLGVPPVLESSLTAACPAPDVFEKVVRWLDKMAPQIRTNQLRQLLHSMREIRPECLRALILRLLRRTEKSSTDRDNIDLLLATYFALCAPEDLYSCEITLGDVAQVLHSVLEDADATELEWCEPLDQVLEAMKQCQGLGPVFRSKLLEKGRELKDAAGFMFYDPAALVAFTRFNFLARRTFFRLLHADLRAIREGLAELERRGLFTVDCRAAGLGMQEATAHLREISLSWRQPISADYADGSANRTFEQLLAIRAAVERAQGIAPQEMELSEFKLSSGQKQQMARPNDGESQSMPAKAREEAVLPGSRTTGVPKPVVAIPTTSAANTSKTQTVQNGSAKRGAQGQRASATAEEPAAKVQAKEPIATAKPVNGAEHRQGTPAPGGGQKRELASQELDSCLEDIWEQLIEAPPTRGRSMSTVTLGDARILLSAWEVNAFVSDGGQLSEDLRRAVAARALVALAREEQKTSGDRRRLDDVIALGREEMKYLQGRVDQAQRTKDTEAAVNLGISARRLLSALEELQT